MCDYPKRVLHVIGAMDRGGAETLIMNVYRSIDRNKIQFDFLVNETRKCDYDDEIELLGGNIYRIPRFKAINLITYSQAVWNFFSNHRDFIAVHGHIGFPCAIYLAIAKHFGLFTIAHSHNTNARLSIPQLGFRVFSFFTRFVADLFLACSLEAGRDRFGTRVIEGNSFAVLKNAIDVREYRFNPEIRREKRKELGIAADSYVVGHVGRFADQKNHHFLIESFARFHELRPNSVLLLIGRGPLEDEIRAKCFELGICDAVEFLGVREDIPDLMMSMDLFVFPSKWEGLGIVAVEAQATGLRCILSNVLPDISFILDNTVKLDLSKGISGCASLMEDAYLYDHGRVIDRARLNQKVVEAGFDIGRISEWLTSLYSDHKIVR